MQQHEKSEINACSRNLKPVISTENIISLTTSLIDTFSLKYQKSVHSLEYTLVIGFESTNIYCFCYRFALVVTFFPLTIYMPGETFSRLFADSFIPLILYIAVSVTAFSSVNTVSTDELGS